MDYFTLYQNLTKAISIEREHKYIDFPGNRMEFSEYILKSLYQIKKKLAREEKAKIDVLIYCFEQYRYDSVSGKQNSVEKLEKALSYYKRQFKKLEPKEMPRDVWQSEIDKIKVDYVKGVGPKLGQLFKKLSIETVSDLFEFYPRKYLDYEGKTRIKDLQEGEDVSFFATIKKVSAYPTSKNLSVIKVTLGDSSGSINITFFYKVRTRRMLERYKAQYPLNAGVLAFGKVKYDNFSSSLTLDKPTIQVINCDFDDDTISYGKIVPIYSLTEDLSSKVLVKAIYNAYQTYRDKIKDPLPEYIIEEENLISKKEAIKLIHFPQSQKDIDKARERLVFDELFIMQANFALAKERNKKIYKSTPLSIKKGGLVERFIKSLPFELTNAQKKAVDEILHDLNSTEPMQRLLQGDVGSGKTVVACICLLCAIENGYQGAIMAPTEILATQHYKNFVEWLTPLNVSVGLFLGKHGTKTRREMLTNLKNGQMNIAVGTHALIQEGVEFNNLGAVIIDEQHRFGVKQRAKLHSKGDYAQMLTMTATPIPRTLALTVHGDLDVTTIDEMPKGRLPVKTELMTLSGQAKAFRLIKEEIAKGHQAYIVYPLIDESETISAKNATQEYEKLKTTVFKDYKLGLLHGKLDNKEKEEVMADFKNKKFDILISTTVVEVGVDVPNATVIVIENAERFGLSQLHQLRGRVGRSSDQSYCVLVSSGSSKTIKDRLGIMTQTNDGFVVAQKDLEIRGPGEFLGTRQSGIQELGITDIVSDVKILERARKQAFNLVENRNIEDYPDLIHEISKKDFFDPMRAG